MTDQTIIDRLRAFVREQQTGGCKVLSQGESCQCALCDLDRMAAALTAAHAERDAAEQRKREVLVMTRYAPCLVGGTGPARPDMDALPDGAWVRYKDVAAALAHLPGHTCHVSGDTCAGCEYAWERDRRIAAALRERDDARPTTSRGVPRGT